MRFTGKIKFLGLLSFVLFTMSCQQFNRGIDEGIMKYEITYLEDKANNPLISLLPSHLEMHFKENSVSLCVEGWMGIFESVFIKQAKTGQSITTLKIMNKKYYYTSDSVEGFMGDVNYLNLEIIFDDRVKNILDYECKHAKVIVPSSSVSFDVYYTEEILIEEPNKNTVFEKIPGVLMEFQVELRGIPMHLRASEITKRKISEEEFCIPKGFIEVDKQDVDTIFASIM